MSWGVLLFSIILKCHIKNIFQTVFITHCYFKSKSKLKTNKHTYTGGNKVPSLEKTEVQTEVS